jgi:hypothetical protein
VFWVRLYHTSNFTFSLPTWPSQPTTDAKCVQFSSCIDVICIQFCGLLHYILPSWEVQGPFNSTVFYYYIKGNRVQQLKLFSCSRNSLQRLITNIIKNFPMDFILNPFIPIPSIIRSTLMLSSHLWHQMWQFSGQFCFRRYLVLFSA